MKRFGSVITIAALAVAAAGAAQAQIPSVPFYPTATGTGVMASADYGNSDGMTAVALTGGIGLGRLGFTASAGRVSNGSEEMAFGGTAAMHLFGGGLTPISIGAQVGVATWDPGERLNYVMPGVSVRASLPLFPIKPWAVIYYPMLDAEEEVRVSVGANFNFLLGLGVHAAYDYGDSGNTWGVGAHFNFRLPVPVP